MKKTPPEERQLNQAQKDAVTFGKGPLLIIAGAGTGKTTVVTERVKYLISSELAKPTEILALTFTEKASREMEERIETGLPYGIPQMWISTFHAFCDRVLRAEAINIGLDPGYRLMTDAETIQFFRRHLFEFNLDYFRPLGNPTKFISGMIAHFSRLRDEDVSPRQYREWVKKNSPELKMIKSDKSKTGKKTKSTSRDMDLLKYTELADAYALYEELKVKESVADYADLISNTLKLFRSRPDILRRYQEQFKYILVDEFQDTNFAQNEMAVLLAGKAANITVVGDDDQAIYRWRGAAISNIIQFRRRFPKAKLVVLTQNYRSTKEILDRSYDLIQKNNPDRLEVAENIDKKLESVRRINGRKVRVFYLDRVENEAERVAGEIKRLKEDPENGYQWSDFAVLVRANAYADPFVRAFARLGLPYQFLGPGQLFRQAEVKDLISYLKLLYDPTDSIAAYRVLSMDFFGISGRDISALVSFGKRYGISIFESAEAATGQNGGGFETSDSPRISADAKEKISQIINMVHRHLDLVKKETAGQILYFFLEDSGMLSQFVTFKTVKEERAAGNIAKFFDKLKSYETDHEDAGIYAVVDWIDLSMTLGESPLAADTDWTSNNAVNILTVHSSKGLEFPVVFVVNLVSLRFPNPDRKEQIPVPDGLIKEIIPEGDSHLEEERRLFYVALTRARDQIYLTAARYYGEGKREKKLSLFIGETLGEEAVAELDVEVSDKNNQLFLFEWDKKPEDTDKLPVRQKVTFLSYSQIESYLTCPLQYKYRSILKIPVPPRAALSFGEIVHRTLQNFYEQVISGSPATEKLILDLFERNWNPAGFGNKAYAEKMKKQGIELLTGFFRKGFNPDIIPINLEQSFKIKVGPELVVGGKIDRVDPLPGGKIEIIDYKTGQPSKSKNPKSDRQLSMYALAATDPGLYGKKPNEVEVSFYYFDTQEKITATRSKEDLDQTKSDILKVADDISKSEFKPTPGKHCDFCDFRLICEAWK